VTSLIIIAVCTLLLLGYLFDLTASRSRIPAVILMLLLGWLARQLTAAFDVALPDLSPILPLFGTIGLILIVLEASLELEINRSKVGLIRNSLIAATIPLLVLAGGLALVFQSAGAGSLREGLMNAIPFCVISSAIAIPSVRHLAAADREFVVYESSLSDIIGVLVFDFVVLNELIDGQTFLTAGLQIGAIAVVSFLATAGLSLLLHRIEHHIKFVPIILLVILIYAVSKVFHLPALVFILLFGLFLGNLDELKGFRLIERLRPDELDREARKLKDLTGEAAFLLRALFFLLFGYLIETAELLNTATLAWSAGIVAGIVVLRATQLRLLRIPLRPHLFLAPRGLITILLFLSIEPAHGLPFVNKSLVMQVIVLTGLLMMVGLGTTAANRPGAGLAGPAAEGAASPP